MWHATIAIVFMQRIVYNPLELISTGQTEFFLCTLKYTMTLELVATKIFVFLVEVYSILFDK